MHRAKKQGKGAPGQTAPSKNPVIYKEWSDKPKHKFLPRRKRQEKAFRAAGLAAILISSLFLGGLLWSVVSSGYQAFVKTKILLPVTFSQDVAGPEGNGDYGQIIRDALHEIFPEVEDRGDVRALQALVGRAAAHDLREKVKTDPALVGQKQYLWLPVASDVDILYKSRLYQLPERRGRMTDRQAAWITALSAQNLLRRDFNTSFFTGGDSREPEEAGILGSVIGSIFTILVCIGIAFPLGVSTAIYLEEFAPENWFTDLIEININNLAAVPSIVFGLLGLSVYLDVFGLPRSSSLVGGMTLALLVLPVIVIATRNAIRAVPKSIRFAAAALGATPVQVAFHHTFIYALPGIMTGVILSIARALGETAPLLMIGMVAFVADIPRTVTDPATTLPVQVFLWANSPETGFVEKTAAAIIVLLAFLIGVNTLAIYIRRRFEIKW